MMGRCKYRHVGLRNQRCSEKQLPFGQNTRKEDKDKAQNIEGHSREVGQHARTSGISNDTETKKLSSYECSDGSAMGHREQNEK